MILKAIISKHRGIVLAVAALLIAGGAALWLSDQDAAESREPMPESAAHYRTGDFNIALALDPTTPRTGDNQLLVDLRDADDRPVGGAELEGRALMPMATMADMRVDLSFREVAPGRYLGRFELPMGGSWSLDLAFDKPGTGQARLELDLATGRPGLALTEGAEVIDEAGEKPDEPRQSDVTAEPAPGAPLARAITIDNKRRQMIGVKTGTAEKRPLIRTVRTAGRVGYDETSLSDISLRFDAWIGELHADFVGTRVRRGETLFTVYGPDLLAAQQEYLSAHRDSTRQAYGGDGLVAAARQRLALWDISKTQIRQLEERGEPLPYMPIQAPRDGTVIDKTVVAGSAAKSGETLMRVADLSRIWIEAEVYGGDVPLVQEGMAATVTLPSLPDNGFAARVEYIDPFMNDSTRTARVRLSLDNPEGALKPAMYAEVGLEADLGERLVVPESAVLVAGERRVVFRDLGDGRLQPVRVVTGQRAEGFVEILEGLDAGDAIVVSGLFLIASETKLRPGVDQW